MSMDSRWKARLWLGLVFVLGGAIGGVFGYSFAHHSYAATTANTPTLSEPERRAKRVEEMSKEVGLTPEQGAGVEAVIHQAHDEMKIIRDKSDAEVDVIRQKAREQIRQLLTPEQRPKYEAMIQRLDAERKKQAEGSKK